MSRHWRTIGFGLVLLALCTSCASQEKAQRMAAAKETAWQSLKQMCSNLEEKDQRRWGMREIKLIGLWKRVKSANEVEDSPNTFKVILNARFTGVNLEGESVKAEREVEMLIAQKTGEEGWHLQGYELLDETELSFWWQLLEWVALSYAVPLAVFVFALMASDSSEIVAWLILILGPLFALVWAGIAAYHLFGTALAVVLCVPTFVVLSLLLFAWASKSQVVAGILTVLGLVLACGGMAAMQ